MILKTNRLQLKKISENDCNRICELFQNEIIKKTYILPDFKSKEEVEKLFNHVLKLSNSDNHYIFGIYLNNYLIGMVNDVYINNKEIEFGYFIDPLYFNNGYMSEAFKEVINYMFSLGFEKIVASAFEENKASFKVMINCQMQKEDIKEEIEYKGLKHNCIYYSIKK